MIGCVFEFYDYSVWREKVVVNDVREEGEEYDIREGEGMCW